MPALAIEPYEGGFVIRMEGELCSGWLAHDHCPPDVPTRYYKRAIVNQARSAVLFPDIDAAMEAVRYLQWSETYRGCDAKLPAGFCYDD